MGRASVLCFLGATLTLSLCSEMSPSELRAHVLEGYDPKVTPIPNKPNIIRIGMIINHFGLDEQDGEFSANVWLTVTWVDHRVSWNRSESQTGTLRFANHELWQPDLTLINNAYPLETEHFGETQLVVDPDGVVTWTPPARLVSHCSLKMIRWPYDQHDCMLKLGSWTHSGDEVDIQLLPKVMQDPEHAIDRDIYVDNSEWDLVKTDAVVEAEYYACCTSPYKVVKYSFTVQRSSPSYIATIILPIIVISFVNIMVFLLPPTAGEKITLASMNILIICMFLVYFEARLPALGDQLPLLVVLYTCNLVLVGISLVISVIVINISRNRKASSPPQCIRIFCNGNFAQLLGLGYIVPYVSQTHSRLDEGVEMRSPHENGRLSSFLDKDDPTTLVNEPSSGYGNNAEWILVAAMIDRLTLIVYVVVCGITTGLCLC